MTLSIEQLRAAFKSPEKNETTHLPNNYYAFWNIQEGETCTLRFLPDKNQENVRGFVVEKVMHNLTINGEKKSVPCLTMYGEDCPICKVSQEYYKTEGQESVNGKKYWKKKQHIAQALIVEDPLPADKDTGETNVGQVRLVSLGYQLFSIIKEAFEGGDLDVVPYAYKGGTDFVIKKTLKGKFASYDVGSKFVRHSTDLSEDVVANLALLDLATVLPKHPGREKIEAMLEADLSGTAYDDGSSNKKSTASSKSAAPARAARAQIEDMDEDVPFTESKPVTRVQSTPPQANANVGDDDEAEANRIIAAIRARKATAEQG